MKLEIKFTIDHKDLGDVYVALKGVKLDDWQVNEASTKQKALPSPDKTSKPKGNMTSIVQQLIEEADQISRAQLIARLKKHKLKTTGVSQTLKSLIDQERIVRVGAGVYAKAA